MSLQFSDTNNNAGIVQLIDSNIKTNRVSYSLKDITRDVNLALDYIYATIFDCGGTWQFDDSNHTDYPIITTSLASGTRDYPFVLDEQGNFILDIYRVMVKDQAGIYHEIYPVDMQSETDMQSFYNGINTTGVPTRYDKTANGILLDVIPSYNSSEGLKVFINRSGSYFSSTDTTKKPGFSALFHEYLALRPSYQYAFRNSLKNAGAIQNEMLLMEEKIKKHYGKRERDIKRQLKANIENNK